MMVEDKHKLINQVEENLITNIIDMTNGTLLEDKEVNIAEELPNVNIVSPKFSSCSVQKSLIAPAIKKRQCIKSEDLSEDKTNNPEKPLSEDEFE